MNEADRTNYVANTKNRTTAFGLGVNGKPSSMLEVGAGVSVVRDVTKYSLSPDRLAAANNVLQNAIGLPDVLFSETRYGALRKCASTSEATLRFDIARIVSKLKEIATGATTACPLSLGRHHGQPVDPHQQVTFAAALHLQVLATA